MKILVLAILLLCFYNIAIGVSQKASKKSSDSQGTGHFEKAGTFEMKSPNLNDEEFHSGHMPDHLKCDSCRAIAYQMQEYLSKRESQISAVKEGKAILSESDYTDTLEKCCSQSWERHGVIEVDGVKRLSGPGLETEDFTGVMMLSGPWPGSKHEEICRCWKFKQHTQNAGGTQQARQHLYGEALSTFRAETLRQDKPKGKIVRDLKVVGGGGNAK
ncbi:marginal zone B- and B1-cell-specific protein-like isoform X1 [Hemitrygon akajei]|uniref:marginal zone B- and B1-cell-specific protein-like isoform X1 n=1 Tax=Hemitrygon akajei TaxID=2704970 RepID=UPI003BF9A0BB